MHCSTCRGVFKPSICLRSLNSGLFTSACPVGGDETQPPNVALTRDALWQLNYGVSAVVGPLTNIDALVLATLFSAAEVPLISPGATMPLLSSKLLFPYFARTIPSD